MLQDPGDEGNQVSTFVLRPVPQEGVKPGTVNLVKIPQLRKSQSLGQQWGVGKGWGPIIVVLLN